MRRPALRGEELQMPAVISIHCIWCLQKITYLANQARDSNLGGPDYDYSSSIEHVCVGVWIKTIEKSDLRTTEARYKAQHIYVVIYRSARLRDWQSVLLLLQDILRSYKFLPQRELWWCVGNEKNETVASCRYQASPGANNGLPLLNVWTLRRFIIACLNRSKRLHVTCRSFQISRRRFQWWWGRWW